MAARLAPPAGSTLFLDPQLLGASRIVFADGKLGVNTTVDDVMLAPFSSGAVAADWAKGTPVELTVEELSREAPPEGAEYGELPAAAAKGKSYDAWSKAFAQWAIANRSLELWRSPSQGVLSQPGESEKDFRVRLQLKAREARDAGAEALRQRYAPQHERLQRALLAAQQRVEREKAESTQAKLQTAVSIGASVLGALLGRKAISSTNIGRATTAARSAGRAMKQSQDVDLANASVEEVQQKLAELDAQLQADLQQAQAAADPSTEKLETVVVRPSRTRVSVKLVGLAWLPHWKDAEGQLTPAWS